MRELVRLIAGDCRAKMQAMIDQGVQVDSVVVDPPYGLSEHGDVAPVMAAWAAGEAIDPGEKRKGFMGKAWDGFVPGPEYWRLAFQLLKPGGHLLCFAGSRTSDLMGIALRLAGFEIRDQIMWVYGSGFPKSHNVSKAIDKAAGAEREVVGVSPHAANRSADMGYHGGSENEGERTITAPATAAARQWDGWGTALKPAHEPIWVARKPIAERNVAANVVAHGTGAINVDGCRVGMDCDERERIDNRSGGQTDSNHWQGPGVARNIGEKFKSHPSGRFPANLIHDGSDEVEAVFAKAGERPGATSNGRKGTAPSGFLGSLGAQAQKPGRGDTGSASGFFYCAKATKADRNAGLGDAEVNTHPTVKPADLMAYLCRLVTPPGGVILDPFMGSGSTGKGAVRGGFRFIGIESDPDSVEIANRRIAHELGDQSDAA